MTDASRDSRTLAAAPADSEDWDDETWAAWWRAAERVHGDQCAKGSVA